MIILTVGFTFSERGYRDGAKFTRIHSTTKNLPINEDGDIDDSISAISDITKSLWEKSSDQREKINNLLQN